MRRLTRSDFVNLALMLATGAVVGVVTVAASLVAERRDRQEHRSWRVLDEDLPEELSETELAMEACHVALP